MHNTPHANPWWPPSRLLLATLLTALLLLFGVLGWAAWQWTILEATTPFLALAIRGAVFLLPVAGAVEAGVIIWRRWATHEYIKAGHVTRLTQAEVQRFPAALTSLSFHDSRRPQVTQPPEPLALPEPEPTIPTFAQLLDAGKIGPGRPLILGYNAETGAAIEGGWDSLWSCGIGALQGAGKSWLAAFLIGQSAAQGGRLIVCDLHADHPTESLAARIRALSPAFMCDVASTPDAILAALKLANDKLAQRKAGRGGNWPIIVCVDEWTSLLRTKIGDVLPGYVEDFAEQGRKFNVNCLLAAQGWTKDTAGTVRNRLTSHYVLRQRPDEARYQLGLSAGQLPLDVRFLKDAEGYLLTVRGDLVKVQIPKMEASKGLGSTDQRPGCHRAAGAVS